MKQCYTIPYKPDSMNTHWRIAKNGGQYLSKAGREFRDNVQNYIKLYKYKTYEKSVKVKLDLYFANLQSLILLTLHFLFFYCNNLHFEKIYLYFEN